MHSAAGLSQNITIPAIPELFDSSFLDRLLPPSADDVDWTMIEAGDGKPTNMMMDALIATGNRTRTANGAPALSSTGDAILDAFNKIGRYASPQKMPALLDASWKEDPALTLRLIWYVRSIHDGKSEQEAFYRAFDWLYKNHPRTAISNLRQLVVPACITSKEKGAVGAHGYWKDLLNLVHLAVCDEMETPGEHAMPFQCFHTYVPKGTRIGEPAEIRAARVDKAQRRHEQLVQHLADPKFRALYVAVARLFAEQLEKDGEIMQRLGRAGPDVDKIALSKELTLVGKWAPTPGGAHDRATNLSTAIASILYQRVCASQICPTPSVLREIPDPLALTASADSSLVLRSYYHRWFLTPLRAQLKIPEPLMCAQRWQEINYSRVPAVCMKRNSLQFFKHDPEGFSKYMVGVESGKRTIAGATLLPHELLHEAMVLHDQLRLADNTKVPKHVRARAAALKPGVEMEMRVVEAQWRALVDRLRESGQLDNALAICDVSGSMGGVSWVRKDDHTEDQPIWPALALSLLLASVARPPFNGGFISFSANPQFVRLDLNGKSLAELVEEMDGSDWGMNTDFEAVFLKLLLPLAKEHNVPREEMIKRLFVFSDMQFDEAERPVDSDGKAPEKWGTNHDAIERAYKEAGYDMPEIVYWDLSTRSRQTMEAEATRQGVAMMSGFSASMMKVFLGEEVEEAEVVGDFEEVEAAKGEKMDRPRKEFNPVNVMKKALGKASFDGLVVVD